MLFVVPVVLFDMLKAKQLACVSESGQKCPAARSLSLRRAWIEIVVFAPWKGLFLQSLSLRRAWIEINKSDKRTNWFGRSPYGERGLKFQWSAWRPVVSESLSLRRAWIEIPHGNHSSRNMESLSLRRAWIEMLRCPLSSWERTSLSLRRAWIEIIMESSKSRMR